MTTEDEWRTMIDDLQRQINGLKQENVRLHEGLAQLRQLCESLLEGLPASSMREPEAGVKRKR